MDSVQQSENQEPSLQMAANPLENKARQEIPKAFSQVNDTATRLALFINELNKVKDSSSSENVGTP
ncbi:hypothetical protein QQ054_28915 [Oscillatoria amoena NRMC-F 0135]|nr:hypothetical protein [Oscillatoria amoena NRMC-F 0135]